MAGATNLMDNMARRGDGEGKGERERMQAGPSSILDRFLLGTSLMH